VGDSGRIWYSGSPEVTNYDHVEHDSGHVLVVEVDLDDPTHPVTVESRTVGSWRFLTLHHEVNNSRDIADLKVNLDQLPDKDRTVVQLALVGTLTVTDRAALDTLLDRHARLFGCLDSWDRHTNLAVMPADDEFDDLGIGGFAADAVDELIETARSGGADADAARAALGLLLRLREGAA
jgi:DNA repair exonuclease SbcCD nuclease subunit